MVFGEMRMISDTSKGRENVSKIGRCLNPIGSGPGYRSFSVIMARVGFAELPLEDECLFRRAVEARVRPMGEGVEV